MATALGYVDHRLFAGLGARLIFGRRPGGSVVRIEDVPSGLACDCVCPAVDCAQPLIASKGEKVAHHFRHVSGAVGCSGAETSAHIWAKQVLEQEKAIWLPAIEAMVKGVTVTLFPKQKFKFDAVRLETRIGEVVPDVVLSKGAHDLIVEVQVTHACGPEKIGKLEAAGMSTLEVDLSAYRTCDDEAKVRKAILTTAPRRWLVNSKLAAAEQAARLKAAEVEADRRRAAEAQAADLLRQLVEAPKMSEEPFRPLVEAAEALGLGHLLDGPEPAPSGFAVSTRTWRAAVVIRVIYPATAPGHSSWQPTVDFDQAAEKIRDLWALPFRPKIEPRVLRALSRRRPAIAHPTDDVGAFLELLLQDGLLTYAKGDYSVATHHRQALRDGAKAINERTKRSKDIAEKVDAILQLADVDERSGFRLDDWMRTPPPGFSASPADLIATGDEEFERLESALYRLEPMPWRRSIPTDAVGLPVERYLEREAEMARAAEAAAEAARQAETEKARLSRIDRIRAYATAALGWTGEEWLERMPANATVSRLAAAGASDEGYERVRRGVEKVAADRRQAQEEAEAMARRQAVLRRRAAAALPETHAAFFLNNARGELGRRTPLEACGSDRGLDDALALLPKGRRH